MPSAFISIGSNLRREANVRSAVRALRLEFDRVRLSPVYESEAEGFDGPDFLNLVAGVECNLPLEALCDRLRDIERAHGRRGAERDGSRTLDLDLLLYGDVVRHDDAIDVPRGEIRRYAFVLRPLCDIAGAERHPELGCTFDELWERSGFQGQRLRPVDFDPDADDGARRRRDAGQVG